MDVADALILGLLAVADLALVVQLRRARARRVRTERIMRSLELAIQREVAAQELAPARRWTPLRDAS